MSSVYIGHFTLFAMRFGPVVHNPERDERVRRALTDRRNQVRAIQIADAAADDRRLRVIQRPGETCSRPEVDRYPARTAPADPAADRNPACVRSVAVS